MCANTRKSRLQMLRTTSRKLGGKGLPGVFGKSASLNTCPSIQVKSLSTYSGAEHWMGLVAFESAQRYSYFGPALILGQRSGVQNSAMLPCSMAAALKKSQVLSASHSLRSSPGGSRTASRRLPLPSVAWMCLRSASVGPPPTPSAPADGGPLPAGPPPWPPAPCVPRACCGPGPPPCPPAAAAGGLAALPFG